jgi:very-short-patch-repair endonuclease
MTTIHRRRADIEGQLLQELRGRDLSGPPFDSLVDLRCLVADVGPLCLATGPTAAALWGFDGYRLRAPFHLVVPRGRNVVRIGHHVHTSHDLPLIDRSTAWGVPCTTPTRTLLALAAVDPVDRVVTALEGAIRDGLVGESFLHRRLAELRRSGRNGVSALLAAVEHHEITRGGHSWLEREFLLLVASSGLPRPTTQVVLGRRGDRVIRVDVHFPDTSLVVELLGYRWHRSRSQLRSDIERTNRLALEGFVVLQFSYHDVVERPTQVVATLREALAADATRRTDVG